MKKLAVSWIPRETIFLFFPLIVPSTRFAEYFYSAIKAVFVKQY
jgi:hypothetical protein